MSGIAADDITPWLPPEDLDRVRRQVPMLYLDLLPVRMDDSGTVTQVGLLLRMSHGTLSRALVSGRVLYHETIRQAMLRHLEKDLGPLCLPKLPPSPQPFTIGEYFPTPGSGGAYDPRQHAVSLAYLVKVDGDCQPQQDALDFTWFTPAAAQAPEVLAQLVDGHATVLRRGLAHAGVEA